MRLPPRSPYAGAAGCTRPAGARTFGRAPRQARARARRAACPCVASPSTRSWQSSNQTSNRSVNHVITQSGNRSLCHQTTKQSDNQTIGGVCGWGDGWGD
eukprot:462354-Prymnesium_polylepis.1